MNFCDFKNCHLDIFAPLKLDLHDFLQFLKSEMCQKQYSIQPPEVSIFYLLKLAKLISRKISVPGKLLNFDTV